MPFNKLNTNSYPLFVFYDILKSGERVSNIYFNNEGYNFEKQILIDSTNKRKEINYYRDASLMLDDISGNNDRTYHIDSNDKLEISVESSLHHIDATLFNIEGIRVTSTGASNLDIKNNLKIRTIPEGEITNVKTSLVKNNGIITLSNENGINIEISRNLEIGKTITDQLIKVYNKTGGAIKIGDSNTADAAVKISFSPAPNYTAQALSTPELIDYEEYATNPALDPSNEKRNLWLLGYQDSYWEFPKAWLENSTNQTHIQYLTKAVPDVKRINIIGESNILPANPYISNTFFTDTTPETITQSGYVKLATAAALAKFKYSFDTAGSYSLGHENSTGKIDYLDSKYTVKYPSGYTENLSNGTVPNNAGGLLGFIPKGAKVTFIEDPSQKRIKIVPVIVNNAITEYTVYANEFIFN